MSETSIISDKPESSSYPRVLIILASVVILLFAIIEAYVMNYINQLETLDKSLLSKIFGGSYIYQTDMTPPPTNADTILMLKYIIDAVIIILFFSYLVSWIFQFAKSRFSTFDTDEQKLLAEGTSDSSQLTLTNFLWYRRNGIPFHQLLAMSLLFTYFMTYHIHIYHSLNESILYTEGAHLFFVINIMILIVLFCILLLLRNKLSLNNLSRLNTLVIIFTGFFAFISTTLIDSEAFVLVSTILLLPAIVFTVDKIRRPIKIRIDDHKAAQRFLSEELPDLEEMGISKWVLIALGLSLVYLSFFLIVIYFEYFEHIGVFGDDETVIVRTAWYFSILIVVEVILTFGLVSRLSFSTISSMVKYSLIFFAGILVVFMLNDNFFFAINRWLEDYNITLGGLLVQIVIPTGIMFGMSIAYLVKYDSGNETPVTH